MGRFHTRAKGSCYLQVDCRTQNFVWVLKSLLDSRNGGKVMFSCETAHLFYSLQLTCSFLEESGGKTFPLQKRLQADTENCCGVQAGFVRVSEGGSSSSSIGRR